MKVRVSQNQRGDFFSNFYFLDLIGTKVVFLFTIIKPGLMPVLRKVIIEKMQKP